MPNGAASAVPVTCQWCGASNTNFDWICRSCGLCLDCGRPKKPKKIRQRISKLSSSDKNAVKRAEVPTPAGIRSSVLLPEELIAKWIVKDNPDLAEKITQVS